MTSDILIVTNAFSKCMWLLVFWNCVCQIMALKLKPSLLACICAVCASIVRAFSVCVMQIKGLVYEKTAGMPYKCIINVSCSLTPPSQSKLLLKPLGSNSFNMPNQPSLFGAGHKK